MTNIPTQIFVYIKHLCRQHYYRYAIVPIVVLMINVSYLIDHVELDSFYLFLPDSVREEKRINISQNA